MTMELTKSQPAPLQASFPDAELSSGDGRDAASPKDAEMKFCHPAEMKLSKIKIPDLATLPAPEVDREFIDSCLHLEDCDIRVAEYHRHRFHSQLAGKIERAAQNLHLVNKHIEAVDARIGTLSKKIRKTAELVKEEQKGEERLPWGTLDLFTAAGFGLFSVVLLGMGINTMATYLMDAGFVMFVERPWVAYLLSAVNVGLALLLKVGASWCRDDDAKHRYFVRLWGSGLFSGALWLVSFAIIFPDIGAQGIEEFIAGIGQESSLRDAVLESIFVCSQLISEVCISAALWIHLARVAREHGPALVMASNPEYCGYLRCLSDQKESLRAAVETRARLAGRLKELQALEDAHLSKAKSVLEAALAARRAERYGLDRGCTGSFHHIGSEESR